MFSCLFVIGTNVEFNIKLITTTLDIINGFSLSQIVVKWMNLLSSNNSFFFSRAECCLFLNELWFVSLEADQVSRGIPKMQKRKKNFLCSYMNLTVCCTGTGTSRSSKNSKFGLFFLETPIWWWKLRKFLKIVKNMKFSVCSALRLVLHTNFYSKTAENHLKYKRIHSKRFSKVL